MAVIKSIRSGERFGRWLVIGQAEMYVRPSGKKESQSICRCDCGKVRTVLSSNLRLGYSQSCGCLATERSVAKSSTHRKSNTREYGIWIGMRKRCLNKNSPFFGHYGGRGIKICERWGDFAAFLLDMGNCPDGYSIERIDVNGDYEPSNCKWIDRRKQGQNTRRVRMTKEAQVKVTKARANGMNIMQISKATGINRRSIRRFLNGESFT